MVKGEVKVGWIHKDELVERKLRRGDVSVIPAGSTFYIVNTHRGDRSQMICSIDTTQSMGHSLHQVSRIFAPVYSFLFLLRSHFVLRS